jgi:hypothetical protein
MRKFLASAALAAGTALFALPASAATTIDGYISNVTVRDTDPGLIIAANPLAIPSFTLNEGESFDVDVLTIGTPEGTVNTDFLSLFGEDTVPFPVSVAFTFFAPSGATGAPVSGSTFGFIAPFTGCGVIAGGCGLVDWGAASIFNFGNGGQFSVELFDAVFATPGTANVRGRFTLISDSRPAVPEPAMWAMMLIGFGAIGAMLRARRTKDSGQRLRII